MSPQEETVRLYQDIRENRALQPVGDIAFLSAACPHNLPLQPTPFVGRKDELAEIGRLLENPDCRMLTLIGPGGIGKTRLALQAALRVTTKRGVFANGVHLVPLASLVSTEFLVSAIGGSLGFLFHGSADPKEQLLDYLREKKMLLLLDNFEHLLEGAGLLAEILSNVPGIKLLITSRERLNLRWEWPLEIDGLEFPHDDEATDLMNYSATQLFIQSAKRAYPRFLLEAKENPLIARICRSLEGIPLAIELTAAWVETFSCQEIAQKIEHNLSLLTTDLQDVPDRHRSLWAAFDHSWSFLSPEERGLFRGLSVFRGGFQREAAEQVTGSSVSLLSALMHKSLLHRTHTGRYRMLEVLRQYAERKLQQDPEEHNQTSNRHCEYYAEFLDQEEESLESRKREQALKRIGDEIDNIEVGWQWAVSQKKPPAVAKYLTGLCDYYETQGWYKVGETALEEAVKDWGGIDDLTSGRLEARKDMLLGRLLTHQGRFHYYLSRYDRAKDSLQTSLSILRSFKKSKELAFALDSLGLVALQLGEFEESSQLHEESLAIYRGHGALRGIGSCFRNLGNVALRQGKHQEAEQLSQQGLATFKEIDDQAGIGDCLNSLGTVAAMTGKYEKARQLYQEFLTVSKKRGYQRGVSNALINLANIAGVLGEYAKARQFYLESLAILKDTGNRQGEAICLQNLGNVAQNLGKFHEARQLFQDSLVIREEMGDRLGMALSLGGLGLVAQRLEEYKEAERLHRESITITREIGAHRWAAASLNNLGFTLCALGEYGEAEVHFRKVLQIALDTEATPLALEALAGLATVLVDKGKREQAAELADHVLYHPATDAETKERAQQLLSRLQSQLPPKTLAEAQGRGKMRETDYYIRIHCRVQEH